MSSAALDRRQFVSCAAASLTALSLSGAASARTLEAVRGFVIPRMRAAGIPGMAVGLAKDGDVALTLGVGLADVATKRPVTTETMFHIASITKTITATAVMMLVEDGRIGLDAPIADYLDFPVVNPAHPAAPIRVRHLLMHTSSLSEEAYQKIDFRSRGRDSAIPLRQFLVDLLVPGGRYYSATGCYSQALPGAAWDYVNTGYALLGYLAGRVAGENLQTCIARRIFAPLGMRRVAWRIADVPPALAATPYDDEGGSLAAVEPVGFPDWPAGMLRASIADLTRFLAASANGGAAREARLLTPSNMATMLQMRSLPGLPTWLTGQGLAWGQSDLAASPRPNHWGGDPGVFTVAYLDPARRTGVAVLTNATATSARKDAVKAIAAHMLQSAAAG